MANMHKCSDGTSVNQSQINARYSRSKKKKYAGITFTLICEGCNKEPSVDNDHTIAQARCKVIHKTELIWHPLNYVRSCRKCHMQWESFKSGEWLEHLNVEHRLAFMKKHDPEGYNVRIQLTRTELIEKT